MKDTPELLKASFTHLYLFQCLNINAIFELSTAIRIQYQNIKQSMNTLNWDVCRPLVGFERGQQLSGHCRQVLFPVLRIEENCLLDLEAVTLNIVTYQSYFYG